jgi:hypothetical protein
MRKWLGVIVAVGALAWSGAAYAVVDVDSVPTTAAGQETPGQTVAIKVKDEQGKTILRQTVKTHKSTHAKFKIPDTVARRAKTVDVQTTVNGKTQERRDIPWATFARGGRIEIGGGRMPFVGTPFDGGMPSAVSSTVSNLKFSL